MNNPSPADRVEEALTPPWGPSLDRFLTARDEILAAPPLPPPTFQQEYAPPPPTGPWARDPEDLVPEEEGTGTCGDVPGTSAVEGLGPAGVDCTGATGAAGQLPGPFLFAHARPGGKSIAGALARLHREGQAADGVKIRRLDHGPLLSRDFEALEIRTMAEMLRDNGFIVVDEPIQKGQSFFLQAHRGSAKEETDAAAVAALVPTPRDLEEAMSLFGGPSPPAQVLHHGLVFEDYARKAREEVIPLVCGPEGSALAEALRGSSKAMRRLEVMLGALGTSAGECVDEFLRFRDYAPMAAWDPAWCAPPDIPDGPRQKGRSPKAYHHQFQPGEGRRETAPSRTTRDAARKARKKKKR